MCVVCNVVSEAVCGVKNLLSQLCFSPDWLAGMVYLRPEFLPKPYVRRVSVTPRGNRWISVTGWSRLAGKTFLSSQNRGSR